MDQRDHEVPSLTAARVRKHTHRAGAVRARSCDPYGDAGPTRWQSLWRGANNSRQAGWNPLQRLGPENRRDNGLSKGNIRVFQNVGSGSDLHSPQSYKNLQRDGGRMRTSGETGSVGSYNSERATTFRQLSKVLRSIAARLAPANAVCTPSTTAEAPCSTSHQALGSIRADTVRRATSSESGTGRGA